jgi:hypothetical protein
MAERKPRLGSSRIQAKLVSSRSGREQVEIAKQKQERNQAKQKNKEPAAICKIKQVNPNKWRRVAGHEQQIQKGCHWQQSRCKGRARTPRVTARANRWCHFFKNKRRFGLFFLAKARCHAEISKVEFQKNG